MNNIFPIDVPLTIVWHLTKPDGTAFSLEGYSYRLFYKNGKGKTEAESTHVTPLNNTLSFVFPTGSARFTGEYSLQLVLFQNESLFCTLNYNNAFGFARYAATPAPTQDQEPAMNYVHLYTAAEYYLFQPVVPTVGNDGYWCVNGVKITDGNGEYIPSVHTVRYDSTSKYLIIDEGRVDHEGHSIQQTITDIASALADWEERYAAAEGTPASTGTTSRWGKYNAAEAVREENETSRKQAEGQGDYSNPTTYPNTRRAKEAARQTAETSRQEAEGQGDYSNPTTYPNTRRAKEAARETAETQRQKNEGQLGSSDPDYADSRIAKEIERQENEGIGETGAECAPGSRRYNEYMRQQQEGTPGDEASADGSRWARYKQAEAERDAAYEDAEGEASDEASASGNRWERFNAAEATRNAGMAPLVGYYACETAASTAAKTVSASNYTLANGGSVKVKFTYANTASSPTLNINSTGAKAIIFNGAAASGDNSWAAGDVVEFYYDPTYNSNAGAFVGIVTKISVSQNSQTGHTDINIGNNAYPVASVEEVSQLGQNLYGVNEEQTVPFSAFTKANTVIVAAAANYGTETAKYGSYCTDYVEIPEGITTLRYLANAEIVTGGIAFYDENKNTNIPTPLTNDYRGSTSERTLSVPAGTRYFRASGKSGAYVKYQVVTEGDIDNIQDSIENLNDAVQDINNDIDAIDEQLGPQTLVDAELDKNDLVGGYYTILNSGKLSDIVDPTSTTWGCAITEIKAGSSITVKTKGGNNAKGYYLCDREKNVLAYAQSSGLIEQTITATVDGYIAACTNFDYEDSFSVIATLTTKDLDERVLDNERAIETLKEQAGGLDSRVDALEDKVEDLPSYDQYGLQVFGSEPPKAMKESPSFCSIVRKWGFVGDSFASGYFDINNSTDGITDYDYSWCQIFARLNSASEAYNYSAGGMTAKSWCTGSDGGTRRWNNGTGKILELKQAYVIQLGSNDVNNASLVAGDLSTDVDLSDYNNNADTFAGWIAGVIQRIQSINPRAFFFVATLKYNGESSKRFAFSEVIRQLPTIFTNVYIVDIENYGLHWNTSAVVAKFKNGTHPSPTGCYYQAIMFNTLIDWIINRNMSDFNEIQFVGTDYHN